MSTLCVLYTPHFPHSRIQSTLQSMFSTFHTPRFPQFTLHYTALSLLPPPFSLARGLAPKFPSPSMSNACHAGYTALLVFHNPHSSFSTLYYTPHLACPSSLLPRARSCAQIPYSSSLACDLAPKFPYPSLSNAYHEGFTALLVFHTPNSSFFRQPFILSVKSTFLRLSAD